MFSQRNYSKKTTCVQFAQWIHIRPPYEVQEFVALVESDIAIVWDCIASLGKKLEQQIGFVSFLTVFFVLVFFVIYSSCDYV